MSLFSRQPQSCRNGGSSSNNQKNKDSGITPEEKKRFQIAWKEGLRQIALQFDSWTQISTETEDGSQYLLPKALREKVHSAEGVDGKFVALRDECINILEELRQQKQGERRNLQLEKELQKMDADLLEATQKVTELQNAITILTNDGQNLNSNKKPILNTRFVNSKQFSMGLSSDPAFDEIEECSSSLN